MKNEKNIGERIASARKSKGMTQERFSEILAIRRDRLARWEAGISAVGIQEIVLIAQMLDVSTDYLLGLRNTMSSEKNLQAISDYTGLDDNTIHKLNEIKEASSSQQLSIISDIIQNIDCWEDIYWFVNEIKNNQIMRRRKKRKRSNENV